MIVYLRKGERAEVRTATKVKKSRKVDNPNVLDFDALICKDGQDKDVAEFRFEEVIGWVITSDTGEQ